TSAKTQGSSRGYSLPSLNSTCFVGDSFFFQAEDGIRDLYVTGVQTCALPIWIGAAGDERAHRSPFRRATELEGVHHLRPGLSERSEERREGKSVDRGGRRIIKKKKKTI